MAINTAAYRCRVRMFTLVVGNKETRIQEDKIMSIVISDSYETQIMPVIFMTISVNMEQYTALVENVDKGKIFLHLQKHNVKSDNLYIDKVRDQFIYFIPRDNATYLKDIDTLKSNEDASSIKLTVGLMSDTLINYNKKNFNAVYRNVTTKDLLYIFTAGRTLIMDDLDNNIEYSQLIIPAMATRKEAIDYLFNLNAFYETRYNYFTDYNTTYLTDRKGNAIKGSTYSTVNLDICSITDNKSYYDGIVKDTVHACYLVYINVDDVSMTNNKLMDKLANKFIGVDDDGTTIENINYMVQNKNTSKTEKQMIVRANKEMSKVMRSDIELGEATLNFTKQNIDADIFSPDKAYYVNQYEDYAYYTGKYNIIYKKEILTKTDDEFTTSTSVGLRYIGNKL